MEEGEKTALARRLCNIIHQEIREANPITLEEGFEALGVAFAALAIVSYKMAKDEEED